MEIPYDKHSNLEGYQMQGYKELVFIFGGEKYMGLGQWNENFWAYDGIRDRWQTKSR